MQKKKECEMWFDDLLSSRIFMSAALLLLSGAYKWFTDIEYVFYLSVL